MTLLRMSSHPDCCLSLSCVCRVVVSVTDTRVFLTCWRPNLRTPTCPVCRVGSLTHSLTHSFTRSLCWLSSTEWVSDVGFRVSSNFLLSVSFLLSSEVQVRFLLFFFLGFSINKLRPRLPPAVFLQHLSLIYGFNHLRVFSCRHACEGL